MTDLNWIYILFLLSGLPSLYIIVTSGRKAKQLTITLFVIALFSFLFGVGFDLIYPKEEKSKLREWLELIAIASALCALFVKARNSKPIFARFPIQLAFLPYLVLFFFPLVIDKLAVKNLLQMIYQGGGIIVAFLLFSINQYLYRNRELLLLSCILFLISYILFWIVPSDLGTFDLVLISNILFSVGIICTSLGLKRFSEIKSSDIT